VIAAVLMGLHPL